MKVGIDTNVLFYFLNKDSPFHEDARKNLISLIEKQSAVITQQNIIELTVVLTRRGVSIEMTKEYLQNFIEVMPVLKPTADTIKIFFEQLNKKPVKGVKLFDLYLASTLLSNGVNMLYTYNKKDFIGIENLRIWEPT